jgi:hypothetical protein
MALGSASGEARVVLFPAKTSLPGCPVSADSVLEPFLRPSWYGPAFVAVYTSRST